MKRALLTLFAVLTLIVPLTASAEWVTEQLSWRETRLGGSNGTSIVGVDTTYDVIAAGQVDTVKSFSLNRASPPPRGMAPPAGQVVGVPNQTNGNYADTTTVAWVVFAADSTVPIVPTLSSMTLIFDGRMGPTRANTANTDAGWVKADSALVNGAAGGTLIIGNETVRVPIRSISPYGSTLAFESLRCRITSATGVLTSARVYLRYWQDRSSTPQR
jgi:hypothetical protein